MPKQEIAFRLNEKDKKTVILYITAQLTRQDTDWLMDGMGVYSINRSRHQAPGYEFAYELCIAKDISIMAFEVIQWITDEFRPGT